MKIHKKEEIMEEDQNQITQSNQNMPEVLTNQIYTPAYLKNQIGKLVRVQFLIGTEDLEDRTRNIRRSRSKLYCIKIDRKWKFNVLRYLFNKICCYIQIPC